MRYLLTTNASRPVVAGGRSWNFEPVLARGGTWLGILEADDESASSILASGDPRVGEIIFERYDSLKKKLPARQVNSLAQPNPRGEHPAVAIAEPAASRTAPTTAKAAEPAMAMVELQTTANSPPDEPLLAGGGRRKKW
jgi:hypothetical protein